MQNVPYYILEVASTHGGDTSYVYQLLKEFDCFKSVGIKFQPYKYDLIAEEDYQGFETYRRLYFDDLEWASIFQKAIATGKDIWLDLFDEYSAAILEKNRSSIKGFKLQASVLGNYNLLELLKSKNFDDKLCILNISGFDRKQIVKVVSNLKEYFKGSIILQAGFQSHPTEFIDSGLSKIGFLKREFPHYSVSYTDHLQDTSDDVLLLPFFAHLLGASIIEKHVKCEFLPTPYDAYSSITHIQFKELYDLGNRYTELLQQPFINERERQYLISSTLYPVLKVNKLAGQILSQSDLYFRRTSKRGLNSFEIFDKTKEMYLLAVDIAESMTIQRDVLKKARIGAVVVCRMKSTRLPRKALAKVGKLTSIELCIKNTLQFENIDEVVLATSIHSDDSILKNYTYSGKVKFYQGSEDDVIDRFISIADIYNLDIIIRVTGDSPYRSNEVLQILLHSHFKNGADYTAANNAPIGTNIEVINVEALKRVHKLFNGAPHSEYMSYYFKNNPDLFRLNIVALPNQYLNSFRLTLDYEEDLEVFQAIEREFDHSVNDFDTNKLFEFLDNHPQITNLNKHCEVAYKPNSELMEQIIMHTTYQKRF